MTNLQGLVPGVPRHSPLCCLLLIGTARVSDRPAIAPLGHFFAVGQTGLRVKTQITQQSSRRPKSASVEGFCLSGVALWSREIEEEREWKRTWKTTKGIKKPSTKVVGSLEREGSTAGF